MPLYLRIHKAACSLKFKKKNKTPKNQTKIRGPEADRGLKLLSQSHQNGLKLIPAFAWFSSFLFI